MNRYLYQCSRLFHHFSSNKIACIYIITFTIITLRSPPNLPPPLMDPYSFLHISPNPDGSLTRTAVVPLAAAGDDPSSPAISYDVPLSPAHKTSLRIFLPRNPTTPKLPLILYFHGGGFILFSAATAPFHHSCARLAANLPAAVVSVDYRLAPEHRLPAAYDDAIEALLWARRQAINPDADARLKDSVDWSRCYLMGSSSGGNIAFHTAIRAAKLELSPIRVCGVIMNQPYFGGVERTESELRLAEDKIVPMPVNDLMWELALPVGAERDHEYCDFRVRSPLAGEIKRCLVWGYEGDPLIDRQREVARMMEKAGVEVVARLGEEGFHGVELFRPEKLELLQAEVKEFVCGSSGRL